MKQEKPSYNKRYPWTYSDYYRNPVWIRVVVRACESPSWSLDRWEKFGWPRFYFWQFVVCLVANVANSSFATSSCCKNCSYIEYPVVWSLNTFFSLSQKKRATVFKSKKFWAQGWEQSCATFCKPWLSQHLQSVSVSQRIDPLHIVWYGLCRFRFQSRQEDRTTHPHGHILHLQRGLIATRSSKNMYFPVGGTPRHR